MRIFHLYKRANMSKVPVKSILTKYLSEKVICFSVLLFMVCACRKVIQLDLPLRDPCLVVNGLFTNDSTSYIVTLSRTTKYDFTYNPTSQDFEGGAVVVVSDNVGNIDTLKEISTGTYKTDSTKIEGIIGRGYKIDIYTQEGQHFKSNFEVMHAVPKIDSIYFVRDQNDRSTDNSAYYKFMVYVDWHDPAEMSNYYLWNVSYFWSNQWHNNILWNWVFNDKYINGNFVKKDLVQSDYGGYNWTFKLSQYSLSENAYNFWNLVHEQTQLSGDGIANSTQPLFGNVFNADNPNDYALGYFQVSAKTTATVYITK